jgi:purine-nucleoside phosphorylase
MNPSVGRPLQPTRQENFVTDEIFLYEDYVRSAEIIRRQIHLRPRIGLILGSGLNPFAEKIENPTFISYEHIPGFPVPSVAGHAGRLIVGSLAGKNVLVMQGRCHFYEGHSPQKVTFPIRVMSLLGIKTLIVTNAAGGLNPNFRIGDLMLINDHLNLVGIAGAHPLRGPNLEQFGPRFPSMTHAYHPGLLAAARQAAVHEKLPLHEGVYAYISGPSFETPAEIRYLRMIGADAVGMSTVPEVIVAVHSGMRVIGISGITNVAVSQIEAAEEPSHQEVLEASQIIMPRLTALLIRVLTDMPEDTGE